jgi:hypothetical protein
MRMKHASQLILQFFLFVIPFTANAKGFEGSILLVRESFYDTSYYTYYVSDDNIRIDEFDANKNLLSIYLVNTKSSEVYIVNPAKKLYAKLKKKTQNCFAEGKYSINKTINSKLINGVKCYQWRVRSKEKNTEIAYWVTQNDYTFFEKMVKVINQTENSWDFFCKIPQTEGFFPMMSVERNLVRDEKMRTSVTHIERKPLNSSIFQIPTNYKPFAI